MTGSKPDSLPSKACGGVGSSKSSLSSVASSLLAWTGSEAAATPRFQLELSGSTPLFPTTEGGCIPWTTLATGGLSFTSTAPSLLLALRSGCSAVIRYSGCPASLIHYTWCKGGKLIY